MAELFSKKLLLITATSVPTICQILFQVDFIVLILQMKKLRPIDVICPKSQKKQVAKLEFKCRTTHFQSSCYFLVNFKNKYFVLSNNYIFT